jgi:sulfane dehydrogenase subunit SoxC
MKTPPVAGNGLLNRRKLLQLGSAAAASGVLAPVTASEPWLTKPGIPASPYGEPSGHGRLVRERINSAPFGPEAGSSSTPLQSLNGTITPNSLHFERHHSGIPDIDPDRHQLTIFGQVKKPLTFNLNSLLRYPMQSRILFLECSGNSYQNTFPKPADMSAGELNGLVSCSEWTGVPLHALLDETGLESKASWIIAEGADASSNNRSLPMSLALDDAMIALYQNGEPLRGAQGYPMRLLVPGCEGNLSIKWLRSLKVTDQPAHTREETSKYTDLLENGMARQFSLRMEVKSVITSPSGKMILPEKGIYEISGLAWSGNGHIRRVEVSADGGQSWADAALQSEPEPLRPVRFRIPWRWDGSPAVLQSRATDSKGNVQPTRSSALTGQSPLVIYHYNGIQSWQIDDNGRVSNVYA